MISTHLAIRAIGGLVLAPLFFVGAVVALVQLRRLRVLAADVPVSPRQLGGYTIAFLISVVLFLIALLPWIGLLRAVRFDWTENDVREVEILAFSSPDPAAKADRSIIIKDRGTLSGLFESLRGLQPYTSAGHEHAVGSRYTLRFCRQSDGRWSDYRVTIYPDKEPTGGGVRLAGVYEVALSAGTSELNLGAYQGHDLGRQVERLVQERGGRH